MFFKKINDLPMTKKGYELPGSISFRYPEKCDHAMPTAKLPAGNRLVIVAGA